MARFIRAFVATIALAVGIVAPALFYDANPAADTTYEETRIAHYDADFVVADNGDLAVTETLTVFFPTGNKRGIFRFWDSVDPNDPHVRHFPEDVSVTRDGQPEPFQLTKGDNPRFRVARIGDEDVYLDPGNHVYELRYRIDGVLSRGEAGTQFYWNLIPGGWLQQIDAARLTVSLPTEAESVRCAQGVGTTSGCEARGEGTPELEVITGNLRPNTPVTVLATLDMPTPPAGTTLPWTPRFDRVLGTNLTGLLVILGLAALSALIGLRASWQSHEPKPPYPLQYAPPPGIGPAQAAYIFTERTGRESFVASIMQAAEKGAVSINRHGSDWTVVDEKGAEGWAETDEVTAQIGRLIGKPGGSFTASQRDVAAGQKLQSHLADFDTETKAWAKKAGLMTTSGIKGLGGGLVVLAFVIAFAIIIWRPFDISVLALIPGAFAVMGLPLLRVGSGTRRTARGRDLWSRVGGFHRVLSTRSSKERFDFSGREDLYISYLPWAVALGCAEEWAQKFRTEVGVEPPVPAYLGGYTGSSSSAFVSKAVSDFSSTVDSAIASYQATQSSSSSGSGGGGGFSGGGGGGGGGGGSW